MEKTTFDDYIARFNQQDVTAFDDYIHPELRMLNGTLEFHGVQGMKDHYAKIWASFSEELDVARYVSDERTVAIHMRTHFVSLHDDPESLFGPVRKGETFDFEGVIMYHLLDDKFKDIRVAYNTFIFTDLDGVATSLGIPH